MSSMKFDALLSVVFLTRCRWPTRFITRRLKNYPISITVIGAWAWAWRGLFGRSSLVLSIDGRNYNCMSLSGRPSKARINSGRKRYAYTHQHIRSDPLAFNDINVNVCSHEIRFTCMKQQKPSNTAQKKHEKRVKLDLWHWACYQDACGWVHTIQELISYRYYSK